MPPLNGCTGTWDPLYALRTAELTTGVTPVYDRLEANFRHGYYSGTKKPGRRDRGDDVARRAWIYKPTYLHRRYDGELEIWYMMLHYDEPTNHEKIE